MTIECALTINVIYFLSSRGGYLPSIQWGEQVHPPIQGRYPLSRVGALLSRVGVVFTQEDFLFFDLCAKNPKVSNRYLLSLYVNQKDV